MYKLVSSFSLLFSIFSCPSIGQGYKEYITCVIDCCVATLFRTWHSGWRLEESRVRVQDTNTAKLTYNENETIPSPSNPNANGATINVNTVVVVVPVGNDMWKYSSYFYILHYLSSYLLSVNITPLVVTPIECTKIWRAMNCNAWRSNNSMKGVKLSNNYITNEIFIKIFSKIIITG